MGGFIKCTLREQDKITTAVVNTSIINGILSDFKNVFENDISELIIKESIPKKEITEPFHSQLETITPFSYGYIFIDRINKKAFFLNNYDAISYFSNFNFKEDTYQKLKKQNFKVKISSYSTKKTITKDVRKEFVMRDFIEYKKLFTALPYVKRITSIDKDIKDISSLESVIEELTELRAKRKKTNFTNDLIITEFKEWSFIEDNKNKSSLINLFEYLKLENLLSEKDIEIWKNEIEESSN